MRASLSILLLPVLCVGALGCGATENRSEVILEVYSWWRADSENEAFSEVEAIHEAAHSGVDVQNRENPKATDLRAKVAGHMLAGSPPSTFQANIGADLLRWAAIDTADHATTESRIQPLTDLLDRIEIREPLRRYLSLPPDGEPFGVPINIHRLNVLYYNQESFDQFAAEGKPLDSLATLCPEEPTTEPALGARIAVGLGANNSWVLGTLTFENMLIGVAGAAVYERLFEGKMTSESDWALVRRALECVQYLSSGFVTGNNQDTWDVSANKVGSREADLIVMGDWVNGEIEPYLATGTVASIPFPGTADYYVFTSDTFLLPVGAPHLHETRELLETIASAEAQVAFSHQKGSIPALRDPGAIAQLGQDAIDRSNAFDSLQKVLATSGLFSPDYPGDALFEALSFMVAPGAGPTQVDAVMSMLRAGEPLLAAWQQRLEQPPGVPNRP